ncbi:MAG: hypothetical protein GY724_04780, partial [Actinomycetia bacterium]|nr:hypothetical protein [Actinomycetes bacterium]
LDEIPALAARGVSRLLVPVSPMAGLRTVIKNPDDASSWADTIERYADL